MTTMITGVSSRLAVVLAGAVFVAGQAAAGVVPMAGPITISGGGPDDVTVYQAKGADCSVAAQPADTGQAMGSMLEKALGGERGGCLGDDTQTGPGGAVQLGKTGSGGQAVTLQGTLMGSPVRLSSMTAEDWSKKIAGIPLAEKYVMDFIAAQCGIVPGDPGFPDSGQIRALFDVNSIASPKVSYVRGNNETHEVMVGLAGPMDGADKAPAISCPDGTPVGLRFSDVVHVQFQALDSYLYSFSGEAGNGQGSDVNYPVSIPFAAPGVEQVGEIEDTNNVRWNITWTNPNPQSILVRMVAPIAGNSIFWPSFDKNPSVICKGGVYRLPAPNQPTCRFDPSYGFQGAVVFEGLIGPGMDVDVVYRTASTAGTVASDVTACWDADGNGTVADDVNTCERGGVDPIALETAKKMGPGLETVIVRPAPAMGSLGLGALLLSLSLVGVYRSRRHRR